MSEQRFNEGHDNEGLIDEESADGELSDAEVVRDISIADHCHSLLLLQNKDRRAERRLIAVAGLSAIFIVAEFTGGVLAHSLAIMTDAGHMLSDLLSFIISIVAIRVARSPANRRLSFGFHRAEVLGATVSIIIIWILTTILIMLAIQRIVNNDLDVDSDTMIITASAGVVFNIIMGVVLKCSRHSHSHGIAHSQTPTSANVNVRAAFIHVIGDLVQSIGVLVAAFVIKISGWRLADPICTFLFSIIVLITSVTVIRDIFFVLMEGTPSHIDYGELQSDLMRVDGVRTVHSLNVWSLNTDKTALAVHLAIDDQNKAIETMKAANHLIRFKHGIHLATVQVEPYESLMASCDFCRPLF